jgi:HD-GYP domain-containing protein (c-di-GMP phosphodiesterase class II)
MSEASETITVHPADISGQVVDLTSFGTERAEVDDLIREASAFVLAEPQRALQLAETAREVATVLNYEEGVAWSNYRIGESLYNLSDFTRALDHLQSALLSARQQEKQALVAWSTYRIGFCFFRLGDLEKVSKYSSESLELAEVLENPNLKCRNYNMMAGLHYKGGKYTDAIDLLYRSIQENPGDTESIGLKVASLSNLGLMFTDLGNYEKAIESLKEAYEYTKQTDDKIAMLDALTNISSVYEKLNNMRSAVDFAGQALSLSRAIGSKWHEIHALETMALLRLKQGEHAQALGLFEEALILAEETAYQEGQIVVLAGLGRVHNSLSRHTDALNYYGKSLEIARLIEDYQGQVSALMGMGSVHLKMDNHHAALRALQEGLERAVQAELHNSVIECHLRLAEAYKTGGNFLKALEHFEIHHQLDRDHREFKAEQRRQVLEVELGLESERKARDEAEHLVKLRTQELEFAHIEVAERLANAAEYRDDKTGAHTERVGWLSARIARSLGWDDDQVELMRLAARLHDIGKIGIPDGILLKPAALTPEEFEEMEKHTVIGARILSAGHSDILKLAESIAESHHERWDGTGYPHRLSGDEIPLSGRIVAVADVFDALTRERPYKRPWTLEEALAELERQSGRQFDPRVVDAARAVITTDAISSMEIELIPTFILPDLDMSDPMGPGIEAREPEVYRDSSTLLANLEAFDLDWTNELARSERTGTEITILRFDLEGLEGLRRVGRLTTLGSIRRAFADEMRARLLHLGRLYRVTDDGFAVLVVGQPVGLPQVDHEQAVKLLIGSWRARFPTVMVQVSLETSKPSERSVDAPDVLSERRSMDSGNLVRRSGVPDLE